MADIAVTRGKPAVGAVAERQARRARLHLFDRVFNGLTLAAALVVLVVLGGVLARERVENLESALHTSRRIGMAVGVLMTAQLVTAKQAFDLLRIASQHHNQRVSIIAEQVLDTGQLDL